MSLLARSPIIVDLFAGCGGLTAGFHRAGFRTVGAADILPVALETYHRNFPDAVVAKADLAAVKPADLRYEFGIEPGELDVLVGGPPCQGFSKNVPARHRWLNDPQNRLVTRFLEFTADFRPKFVLMENVAEMKNAYQQAYSSEVEGTLQGLGYSVVSGRLLAADFGVPQLRRRAFFLAALHHAEIALPVPTHHPGASEVPTLIPEARHVCVDDAIDDLPPLVAGEGESPRDYPTRPRSPYQQLMRQDAKVLTDHVARALTPPQLARVKSLKPGSGQGFADLPKPLRPKSGYSGAYARLYPDQPARTITRWVFHPGSGRFFHPYQDRVITIREAARLQSFPDNFTFSGSYNQKAAQIGEAVPPLLGAAFARVILDLLR